jgi:transcriptional regulator with XRE-family HTH domain
MDADPAWFGGRLRELREKAGMSRPDLAKRSGVSLDLVASLEQGRRAAPTWPTVLALATALGVDCTAFAVEPAPRDPAGPGRPPRAEPEAVPAPKRKRGRPRKSDDEQAKGD